MFYGNFGQKLTIVLYIFTQIYLEIVTNYTNVGVILQFSNSAFWYCILLYYVYQWE